MALQASGAISANDINVELGKNGATEFSFGGFNARNLSDVASGAIALNNFYSKALLVTKTGTLWDKTVAASGMVYSINNDTGYKETGKYPKTINMTYAGRQQDASCQQMQRKLSIFTPAGVETVLVDTTSALCDYFGVSHTGYGNGTTEYNRIVGYATGKVASGTYIRIWVSEWIEKKFVVQ